MRILAVQLMLIACLTIHQPVPAEDGPTKSANARDASVTSELDEMVSNKECGLHALYLMLRLRNYDISHEAFRAAVQVGENGSSLADLQRAAQKLGVETGVYHCELDELMKHCDQPVVVLIHNYGAGLIDDALARSRVEVGHYITILGRDEKTGLIVGIDGSEGRVRRFAESRFLDMWTGYVLLPRQISWWSKWKWVIAGNLACWTALLLLLGKSMNKTGVKNGERAESSENLPLESAVA